MSKTVWGSPVPSCNGDMYHVFFIDEYLQPQLIECGIDEEGLQLLADLIRAENVIAVVRGRRVGVDVVNTVIVQDGDDRITSHMPLKAQ